MVSFHHPRRDMICVNVARSLSRVSYKAMRSRHVIKVKHPQMSDCKAGRVVPASTDHCCNLSYVGFANAGKVIFSEQLLEQLPLTISDATEVTL